MGGENTLKIFPIQLVSFEIRIYLPNFISMKPYLFLLLFTLFCFPAMSQDVVYFHPGSHPAYGKVISIQSTSILFAPLTDSLSIRTIPTDSIYQIRFSDSTLFTIYKDVDLNRNKRLWALKTSIAAPLLGHFNIGYEQYVRNGQSIQLTAGLIYTKSYPSDIYEEKGFYARLGYKVNVSKKNIRHQKEKQLLYGLYIQPELIIGSIHSISSGIQQYTYMYGQWINYYVEPPRNSMIRFSGLFLTPGYQFVHANGFTVDLNVSIGYVNHSVVERKYYYTYWSPIDNIRLGLNAGIKIGYAFIHEKRYRVAE